MSTSEIRSQDSTVIIVAGDNAEVTDSTPDWEGSPTEYDRYGEPTGHNYVRRSMCGTEVLNDKTSTASYRSARRRG